MWLFLFTFDAGAAFLSGKHPAPINDSEQGTLLHIGCYSKKEEKVDELLEKAEDLLLEKDWLESIGEIAIFTGAPDADATALAAQAEEASSTAFLALGDDPTHDCHMPWYWRETYPS
jgi:hypothetical protein